MSIPLSSGVLMFAVALVWGAAGGASAKPVFRKPPPEGVVEHIGIAGTGSSLVELTDGSVMLVSGESYRISRDGGVTWGESHSFPEGVAGNGVVRLQSGELALMRTVASGGNLASGWLGAEIQLSSDDGNSWGEALPVRTMGTPYYDTMIQLSTGRLLYPARTCFGNPYHPDVGYHGHSTYPEMDVAAVSHSDDLGETWYIGMKEPTLSWAQDQYASSVLMGWFGPDGEPNGGLGISACDEPSVAETRDGRVLFFARSPMGRIVHSYSSDGGETWTAVRPTELVSCYSPCRLRRVPKTGDLMCVWNQISPEENDFGWRRRRLSVAISEDNGETWGHFKTLELSAGLEDVDRIEPTLSIRWTRLGSRPRTLPEDAALSYYPNVRFAGDKVYIMYGRSWEEEGGRRSEGVLRVCPLEWLYQ